CARLSGTGWANYIRHW
nr:immunoglobulin heavy chain junction region [Macaca mulatta]